MASKIFYTDLSEHGSPQGRPLIEFADGETLKLQPDGGKVLKTKSKNKNVNLMFIFGNARSGKSFMMNCLAGVPGLFKVVNSAVPCTKGVDISSLVVPHGDMVGHVNEYAESKLQANSNLDIGFVDVEGQGDQDGTYDTMLALPLLVTSKVVLFNHKGAPTVSDMLSKLGVLARAADYIDLEDENAAEQEPASAARRRSSVHSNSTKFGHLHVLFRDFSFEGDREAVYDQLMGKEKVVKNMKAGKGSNDPAKASKERNDIRGLLLENFESINVWLFKQPADADALREHKELPEELIDPEFTATAKELLQTVTRQLAAPTYFNGKTLTGPKLEVLIGQVTEQLNSGGAINVPSVFRAMEKEAVMRVAAVLLLELTTRTTELRKLLPLAQAELQEKHHTALRAALEQFDHELTECLLGAEKKQYRTELEMNGKKLVEDLARENRDAVLIKVKTVITEEFGKMRTKFEKYCNDNIPIKEGHQLDVEFAHMKKATIVDVHKGLDVVKGAILMKEYQLLLIENEEALHEFLCLKTMQNENALKDAAINKLREAAIKQQELMIEQNRKLEQYVDDAKAGTAEMERQLSQLRSDKEAEAKKAAETAERLKKQQSELEALRAKRARCTIL